MSACEDPASLGEVSHGCGGPVGDSVVTAAGVDEDALDSVAAVVGLDAGEQLADRTQVGADAAGYGVDCAQVGELGVDLALGAAVSGDQVPGRGVDVRSGTR